MPTLLLSFLACACAGSSGSTPARLDAQPSEASGSSSAAPMSEATVVSSAPTAQQAAPAGAAEAEPAPTSPPAEASSSSHEGALAPRSVKYIVSPDGLRVEVEGVSFTPRAEAVKVGAGYAIKVSVQARAKDGASHSLLAPKTAELAFAGQVVRGSADPERFTDRREGDRELLLEGTKPVLLARTWPQHAEAKPLMPGDELKLLVGLWGLGSDAANRRPLTRFCSVSFSFDAKKGKPKVVVSAPDGL
ncbi:MAG TPA: hypothetical protein VER33_19580 [Polyangiaceae bacterium]|nr:hypothetical protein [Polyangiaceae bacterium]